MTTTVDNTANVKANGEDQAKAGIGSKVGSELNLELKVAKLKVEATAEAASGAKVEFQAEAESEARESELKLKPKATLKLKTLCCAGRSGAHGGDLLGFQHFVLARSYALTLGCSMWEKPLLSRRCSDCLEIT